MSLNFPLTRTGGAESSVRRLEREGLQADDRVGGRDRGHGERDSGQAGGVRAGRDRPRDVEPAAAQVRQEWRARCQPLLTGLDLFV